MSTVGKMTTTTHSYHNMKRFFEEPIMNKYLSYCGCYHGNLKFLEEKSNEFIILEDEIRFYLLRFFNSDPELT
jgi:hypothetical protein